MVKNTQIAFDLKNSKEYVLEYMATELPKDKNPENAKDKQFYIFEKRIVEKDIGTSMLELLNLDFNETSAMYYFIVHYVMIPYLTYAYPKIYKNLEYYKDSNMEFNENKNYDLIVTEEELNAYVNIVMINYAPFFEDFQCVYRFIVDGKFFKAMYATAKKTDKDYFILQKNKDSEDYITALNHMSSHFKDVKINHDIENFFLGNVPENTNVECYYVSDDFNYIFYMSLRELTKIRKKFKIIRCSLCNNYFIPTTGHKTKYCDDIYLDNKTCKEYANTTMADKNYKNNPYLERYRKRYQSLSKEASLSPESKSAILYEHYKKEGAEKTKLYIEGKITGDELVEWVENMKVNNFFNK